MFFGAATQGADFRPHHNRAVQDDAFAADRPTAATILAWGDAGFADTHALDTATLALDTATLEAGDAGVADAQTRALRMQNAARLSASLVAIPRHHFERCSAERQWPVRARWPNGASAVVIPTAGE